MILGGFVEENTSITNLIDLHLNLREQGIKQDLIFAEIEERSYFQYLAKTYNRLDLFIIPIKDNIIKEDLIITTFDFLRNIFLGHFKIRLHCERLIILDSPEVIDVCEKYAKNFYNLFLNSISNDIHFLGNRFINQYSLVKNKHIYYNKLSEARLLSLLKSITPDYKRYKYKMYDTLFSNFGKSIFEANYLGMYVSYNCNKEYDDGLTEYLKLFNIDDNFNQIISIDKGDLVSKLFFHENDLLLGLL